MTVASGQDTDRSMTTNLEEVSFWLTVLEDWPELIGSIPFMARYKSIDLLGSEQGRSRSPYPKGFPVAPPPKGFIPSNSEP